MQGFSSTKTTSVHTKQIKHKTFYLTVICRNEKISCRWNAPQFYCTFALTISENIHARMSNATGRDFRFFFLGGPIIWDASTEFERIFFTVKKKIPSYWMPGWFRFSRPFDSHNSSKPTTNNQTNNPGQTRARDQCNRTSDSQKHLARQFWHVTQEVNGKELDWKEIKRTSLQLSSHSRKVCWVKPLDISEVKGIIYLSFTWRGVFG